MSCRTGASERTTQPFFAATAVGRATGGRRVSELVPLLLPWNVEELAASGIAADLWEALIRAATQVHGDRQPAAEDDALPEDVSGHLEWLCESARQAALGDDPDLGQLPPTTAPARSVLD